jgi:hypothetical protein
VLYRVGQEALANVARHVRGEPRPVSLQAAKGRVSLQVADDGAGFPTGQVADPLGLGRFGLASTRQQIEMAGGAWQVRSRPGRGTTVTATLPMAGPGRAAETAAPAGAADRLQAAATAAEQEQHQQHDDDDQEQGTEPHLASLRVERRLPVLRAG